MLSTKMKMICVSSSLHLNEDKALGRFLSMRQNKQKCQNVKILKYEFF